MTLRNPVVSLPSLLLIFASVDRLEHALPNSVSTAVYDVDLDEYLTMASPTQSPSLKRRRSSLSSSAGSDPLVVKSRRRVCSSSRS